MGPHRGQGPIHVDHEFRCVRPEGYLLLARSNSLITWSVKSMVSLL